MTVRLYLVRWLHDYYYWETVAYGGKPHCPSTPRLVRAFFDPRAATDYCQRLTRGSVPPPREANPFHIFSDEFYQFEGGQIRGLIDLTSMPEPIFCDWLREAGLEPPAEAENGKARAWAGWWTESAPGMTDHQRAKVWQALDRLRFYEIVETELED